MTAVAAERVMSDPFYNSLEDLCGDFLEVSMNRRILIHNLNTPFGWHVYSYAKLMILSFWYDFIAVCFDKADYEPILMDTDSYYIAFCREDWESLARIEPDRMPN